VKEVLEKLFDDLLYSQTGEKVEAAETVRFSIDGEDIEVDLTDDNATMLREALQPFKDAGRPVTKKPSSKKKPTTSGTAPAPSQKKASVSAKDKDAQNAEIREWARNNGFDLSERGRIPDHVKDAWVASQHGAREGEVVHDKLTDEVPDGQVQFDPVTTPEEPQGQEAESAEENQPERV
jgi:hypothetical protein